MSQRDEASCSEKKHSAVGKNPCLLSNSEFVAEQRAYEKKLCIFRLAIFFCCDFFLLALLLLLCSIFMCGSLATVLFLISKWGRTAIFHSACTLILFFLHPRETHTSISSLKIHPDGFVQALTQKFSWKKLRDIHDLQRHLSSRGD